jgi:hypothetical protein
MVISLGMDIYPQVIKSLDKYKFMEFQLTQEVTQDIIDSGKSNVINGLSDELKTFFYTKEYGEDIKSIFIGVICVSNHFDSFFKVRKPKYKKGKEKIIQDGNVLLLYNTLRYDIKLDFEFFLNKSNDHCKYYLADKILNSVDFISQINMIKDFDLVKFKTDLKNFIISSNYLK